MTDQQKSALLAYLIARPNAEPQYVAWKFNCSEATAKRYKKTAESKRKELE